MDTAVEREDEVVESSCLFVTFCIAFVDLLSQLLTSTTGSRRQLAASYLSMKK